MSKLSSQSQHSQHSQQPPHIPKNIAAFNHPQGHSVNQQQATQNPPQQHSQSIAIHPPTITTQIMSHHPRSTAAQIITAPFIDPYITAIPVQPVISSSSFPTSTAVISPLPPTSEYVQTNVMITPAQNQIQDHLQRKHEELQMLIVQQQDELRRVSEQLFMARYGILPSIVNVSLPFVAPIEQSEGIEGSNRCIGNSSHLLQQPTYQDHHHQPQMIQHHVLTSQAQPNSQVQSTSIMQQQMISHHPQQHMTISYEMSSQNKQQNIPSHIEQTLESEASNSDIMHHYMHQPNQSSNIHQMQPQQQQQPIMGNDDFELIPFQMMNQQAQVLYATGSNNNNNNNNNSANTSSANSNK